MPNRPPPSKPRYQAEQVIEALRQNRGLVTAAARQLGCEPLTVRNYIARYPTVAAALVEAREAMLDVAEASLFKEISQGDMSAIRYYLSTQGKARGYVERKEVTGADGEALAVKVYGVDPDGV